MIKTEVVFPDKYPDFDLQEELFEIAEEIFVPIIKSNMDQEKDLTNMKYPPLAEATIKAKRRKSLSPMILHAENRLRNVFLVNKQGKDTVIISISSDRSKIGDILQNKGVKSKAYGLRFFNFFGVNSLMENKAIKFMRNAIEKKIKDAGYK